jgi:hypothetical protein
MGGAAADPAAGIESQHSDKDKSVRDPAIWVTVESCAALGTGTAPGPEARAPRSAHAAEPAAEEAAPACERVLMGTTNAAHLR